MDYIDDLFEAHTLELEEEADILVEDDETPGVFDNINEDLEDLI